MLSGFRLKVAALVFSMFREVIFLDADVVPVENPTYLFDTQEYRSTGALNFWFDFQTTNESFQLIPEVPEWFSLVATASGSRSCNPGSIPNRAAKLFGRHRRPQT